MKEWSSEKRCVASTEHLGCWRVYLHSMQSWDSVSCAWVKITWFTDLSCACWWNKRWLTDSCVVVIYHSVKRLWHHAVQRWCSDVSSFIYCSVQVYCIMSAGCSAECCSVLICSNITSPLTMCLSLQMTSPLFLQSCHNQTTSHAKFIMLIVVTLTVLHLVACLFEA